MFNLTGLTTDLYDTTNLGVPIANIKTVEAGGALATFDLSNDSEYATETSDVLTTTTAYTQGQTVSLAVNPSYVNVNTVTVGNTLLTYSTDGEEGTFFYDNGSGEIVITFPSSTPANTFIRVFGTQQVDLDDVIRKFNYASIIRVDGSTSDIITIYNVLSSLTVTQNFNDYPVANARLMCDNSQLAIVRSLFRNIDNRWIITNIPFRLQTYNETVHKLEEYPAGHIEVNINFEGFYKDQLEEVVFIRKSKNQPELQCDIGDTAKTKEILRNGETENPRNSNEFIVYLSTLARRAGVTLKGATGAYLSFPISTPGDATITLQDAINQVLSRRPDLYAMYSRLDGIWLLKWANPPTHSIITPNIITSNVTNNYNLDDSIAEVYPTKLEWYTGLEDELNPDEVSKQNEKPEYEAIKYEVTTTIDGDDDFDQPYTDRITGMDLNYDVGGQTKTRVTTTYRGNDIVQVKTEIYGFSYDSEDVGSATTLSIAGETVNVFEVDAPAAPYWRKVEDRTEDYYYDEQTQYLLGTRTWGWKRLRYKQETENFEVLKNVDEATIESLADNPRYRWFNHPITGYTAYKLIQFRDFYGKADDNDARFTIYQFCDEFGNPQVGFVRNPNFVEPRFAIETETFYECLATRPDPRNAYLQSGDAVYARMRVGERRKQIVRLKIKASQNTKFITESELGKVVGDVNSQLNLILNEAQGLGDVYETYTTTVQAGDSDFKANTETTTVSTTQGRPGEHTRGSPRYKLVEDGLGHKEQETNPGEVANIYDYACYTSPFTGNEQFGSSSFYEARSLTRAKRLFRYEYEKRLFQNSSNTTLTTLFDCKVYEGEVIGYNFNKQTVPHMRIKSISKNIMVQGEGLLTGYTTYNGNADYLDRKLPLRTARKKRKDNAANPQFELTIILPPYRRGNILTLD